MKSTSINEESHELKAFVPTLGELILYIMTSLFVLVIINSVPAIRASNKDSYVFISKYISDFVQKALAPISNQRSSSFLTFLFWAVIGATTYVIVWLAGTVIYAYRNDLPPIKGFMMPQGLNSKKVWYSTLGRGLVRTLALIAFLYWIYIVLVSIFPYASNLFLGNILKFDIKHLFNVVVSVLTLAACILIGIIFLRCVFLRDRIFGD